MKFNNSFCAGATVVLLNLPTFALADWQYTKWGMSEDEVTAAVTANGGEIRPFKPWLDIKGIKWPYKMTTTYTSAQFKFDASFRFSDSLPKRLVDVTLVLLDKKTCPDLQSALETLYGPPPDTRHLSEIEKMKSRLSIKWIDKPNNNKVAFNPVPQQYVEPCVLSYEELAIAGSTKGL